jgi:hypothetical protein
MYGYICHRETGNQFLEMACFYGDLHDSTRLFWFTHCVPGRIDDGILMIQEILGGLILIIAVAMIAMRFKKQVTVGEGNHQCDDC